jgi:microcystin-dependent protein
MNQNINCASILNRLLFSSFIYCISATLVFAQSAALLPNALQTYFDANGNPLSGGTVTFYYPATTNLKPIWQDANESVVYTNPVTLNAAGQPPSATGIYGQGAYRQIVKDINNNTIWDALTSSAGAGATTVATGDGDLVGTVKPWAGITAPNQYQFAYGQQLNRTTFAALFTAITLSTTVTCTSSSNTLSGISDTTSIPVGAAIEVSACVAPGTTISSKTSSTVVMSNPSSVSINTTAVFFPFGNGDGTTTFTLPDFRGNVIAGRSNMGGTASTNLTNCTNAAQGTTCGNQNTTLVIANLPNNTISANSGYAPGNVALNNAPNANQAIVQSDALIATTASSSGAFVVNNGHIIQSTTLTVPIPSYLPSINLNGNVTQTPFSTIQPTITLNYIIKVTADTNSAIATGVTDISGMVGSIACGTGITCTGNVISFGGVNTPAATFSGNPLSSIGPLVNFTIQGLTARGAPDVNNDKIVIYDNSAGSFKYVTPGLIASSATSGVSSLGGLTGALTISGSLNASGSKIGSNILRSVTSNDTVLISDCGKTLQLNSAFFTETLPVVAGFSIDCVVVITNTDTTRGKALSGFPSDVLTILYPLQTIQVAIVNGAWKTLVTSERWKIPSGTTTIYIDPISGVATNDGLNSASPITVERAVVVLASELDTGSNTNTLVFQYTNTASWTNHGFISQGYHGSGNIVLQGDTTTPNNFFCSADAITSCFNFNQVNGSCGNYTVQGFSTRAASQNGAFGIFVQGACNRVQFGKINFWGGPQWTAIGGQFSANVVDTGATNNYYGGGSFLVQAVDGFSIHLTSGAEVCNNPTVTITIASPAVITLTGHHFSSGTPISFITSGALPTGITAGTIYYVIAAGLTANTFEISTSQGGAAVNTSGSQSGVQNTTPAYITDLFDGHGQALIGTSASNWTGTCTGKRYSMGLLSLLDSAGSSTTLPGTTAGTPVQGSDATVGSGGYVN